MSAPRRKEIASAGGELRAEFVPEAGMLCCSLRRGGEELLAQRRGIDAYAREGKTMGIPLLYPWANRLAGGEYEIAGRRVRLAPDSRLLSRDPYGLPIHGVIGGRLHWRLEQPEEQPEPQAPPGASVAASLRWSDPELLEVFPFPHSVSLRAFVEEDALTVAVTVHADAGSAVPVSFGFHPYLALAPGMRAQAQLELPVDRRLELDRQMIPTGASSPFAAGPHVLGERDWDDAFAGPRAPAAIVLQAGAARRELDFLQGYRCSQVFSPRGADFVCIEPMTAPANALRSGEAVVLAAGESFSASFRLRLGGPAKPRS